jgi:hypothetical protein
MREMEDTMNRVIAALALILMAGPASALERSPSDRGIADHDRGDRATAERGERMSGGRDRTINGPETGKSRSYSTHDRSGRAGDRD